MVVSGDGTFESDVGMLLPALLLPRDAEQETREETERRPHPRHLPTAMRMGGDCRGDEPWTVGETLDTTAVSRRNVSRAAFAWLFEFFRRQSRGGDKQESYSQERRRPLIGALNKTSCMTREWRDVLGGIVRE